MDLYQAILQQESKQPHIARSLRLCEEWVKKVSLSGLALSWNGGKDCTVVLHLLRAALAGSSVKTVSRDSPLKGLQALLFKIDDEFEEAMQFAKDMAKKYEFEIVPLDPPFKQSLQVLLKTRPIKAIFMGQRKGDPEAVNSAVAKSDHGWPDFLRLNPILDWTYAQVWDFLLAFKLPYCTLYDLGYTSLGSTSKTIRNPALRTSTGDYLPAYRLTDGSKEREGRVKASNTSSFADNQCPPKANATTDATVSAQTVSSMSSLSSTQEHKEATNPKSAL